MTKTNLRVRCFWACTVLGLPLALLLLSGCSGTSKNSTVSGKVTYKGQPVTGGTLTLHPTDGKGGSFPPIPIKPDGTFMTTDVPAGSWQVAIETESIKGMPTGGYNAKPPQGQKPPDGAAPKMPEIDTSGQPKYVQIPKKYSDPKTSNLTWDIVKGKNDKTFELTD
jgi:hypothetical protein